MLLLGACAVPDADKAIENAGSAPVESNPRIEGANGPLTAGQAKAVLASLSQRADDTSILDRHLAIEEAVAGSPLTANNRVDVLHNGSETFRAIHDAIRDARRRIDLEFYIVEDVTLVDGADGGVKLSDLLIEKRREGVEVNIIYDGYGSSDAPAEFFERLSDAGVRLLEYHPIAPTNPVNVVTLNNRTHRKIVVADGTVGIVGGVNLSKSYESKSPGSDDDEEEAETPDAGPGPATELPDEWFDAAVRIEGPAVAELQALFQQQWADEGGEPLPPLPPDEPAARGNQVVRIIGSTPDEEMPRYYVTLISALRSAESRAWISTAYFVPTPEGKEELITAAKRGIDVRLLLAGNSDSKEAVAAAQTHYSDLLRAGVRIYEVKEMVLHSKTVVIDGVWSAIGSSNLDYRSVIHNDEVDAIVLGAETAGELERMFENGIAMAEEIDRETWEESRPFSERFHGFLVRMWEHLL